MHISVLKKEVIEYLNPGPNKNFIDCTFGEGGHSIEILKHNKPKGKVLGIEIDHKLFKIAQEKIKKENPAVFKRLVIVNRSYKEIDRVAKEYNFFPVHGILFDLGISMWHLKESKRGFSFLKDEPLDMRYSQNNPLTAFRIINFWPQKAIEKVLREFGEEKFSSRIALRIIKERREKEIRTSQELAEIVKRAIPKKYWPQKIHPATKTFQALRIAVNNELEHLTIGLEKGFRILSKKGRLVVISFHSLEDRRVKRFFQRKLKEGQAVILTKKPITPSDQEKSQNPSSRSAKLRALKKV